MFQVTQKLLESVRAVAIQFVASFLVKKLHITYPTDISFTSLLRNGVHFHTFPLKEEKEIKAILRGLRTTTNVDSIQEELVLKGFQPTYESTLNIRYIDIRGLSGNTQVPNNSFFEG